MTHTRRANRKIFLGNNVFFSDDDDSIYLLCSQLSGVSVCRCVRNAFHLMTLIRRPHATYVQPGDGAPKITESGRGAIHTFSSLN